MAAEKRDICINIEENRWRKRNISETSRRSCRKSKNETINDVAA
jgi:hypothetical protein